MPYTEIRGNSIRVKWWTGQYKLDDDGKPTAAKLHGSASKNLDGAPFADEGEAFTFGLDRESDVRNRRNRRTADPISMADYCDTWFKGVSLRSNSMSSYGSRLTAVIRPYWAQSNVDEITPIQYDAFRKFVQGEYSHNYAKAVLGTFKMLMDDAVVKYKYREESPIVEQNRRGLYKKKQVRRVKRRLSTRSVHQLAHNAFHVWGFAGWTYVWTIAFTGMRSPGEMFGLQRGYASPYWPASEPDDELREEALQRYESLHALRVQYQTYRAAGQAVLAAPKYDSARTLVLPPFLHEMHQALLASHAEPWAFLSLQGKPLLSTDFDNTYWFPIRDGAEERAPRPRYERWVRPALPAVEEMAGEDIYRLRHWHKAKLDEPGDIPRVAVEERMGHELPGVEGTYSEVTLAMEERIVGYLQRVWEKEVVGAGLWTPTFPIRLPDDPAESAPPQFSGLPILEYE
ncbi:integrase [Streptomyces sp. H27-C3]|uniref:integrase n=1 Tax=Streptomyces sp. H27-C3 TaxID=3046305 RepID=UPI0024BA109F|nr:integrase [Streptomyces sp. H27-C3]MDJ0460299.1 integrase [Streptomyces sp. H27-C3]